MSNFINVDELAYAIQTKDDKTGVNYNAIKQVPGIVKISVDPSIGTGAFWGDAQIQEYAQTLGEIKLGVDVSTLPLWVQADWLGHATDGMGGIVYNSSDKAPYIALFYRRIKANGKKRYIKLYKCLFGDGKDDAEVSPGIPKIQNDSLTGVAMPRIFDANWRKAYDEEEPGYVDVSTTWNTAVDLPADTTPPTVSSITPANNATGVLATTVITWVFSESLNPSTVIANNFYLIKDTDGSIVTGTLSYNDATKTVVLTPSANLSPATKYLAVADLDITDLSGNHLENTIKMFTTA